jgi:hypothetical protein
MDHSSVRQRPNNLRGNKEFQLSFLAKSWNESAKAELEDDEAIARRYNTAPVADSQRPSTTVRCSKHAHARIAKGDGLCCLHQKSG